jgi:hypothetical protein
MKVKLLDTELFIKVNNLKQVTNSIILDRGFTPTVDGLLSTEIFGTTPKERKSTFAYIDLYGYFFQPLVYKQIKRMDRRIDYIIGGTKKYIIDKTGQLVEDDDGETGLDWLYKNWEKIVWKSTGSRVRDQRISLLTDNSKKELFTRYFIVEPAFYRDINLQDVGNGRPSIHEINTGSEQTNGSSYSKLIRLASTLKRSGGFVFALNNTKFQIQMCMVDIYNYFKSRIEKKYGIIKKGILGKTIDYGSRMVISSSHFNNDKYTDMAVDFNYTGLPLANCISNAKPFFTGWLANFFKNEFEAMGNKYPFLDKDGNLGYIKVKNPEAYYNDEYCEKLMAKFIYSYSERFDKIEVPNFENNPNVFMVFRGRLANINQEEPKKLGIGDRFMTLTDLFYMAAEDIYKDKHVIVTRYPILSFQSLYTSKVRVLSTQQVCTMNVNGHIYKFYPVVDLNKKKDDVATAFIEVLMLSNVYLKTMGADYDGDQVSVRVVFSQEANAECERLHGAPTNFLSANGTNVRVTTNEAIQTLYMLTKDA